MGKTMINVLDKVFVYSILGIVGVCAGVMATNLFVNMRNLVIAIYHICVGG